MSVLLTPALLERTAADIRGPTGLVSFLLDEVNRNELHAELPPDLIERARRGVTRLLGIADRLSRAAQLESEGLVLSRRRLELGLLARMCFEQARMSELRSEVSVEVQVAESTNLVEADPFWLSAALVDVAVAMIHRARSRVTALLELESSGLVLSVRDDGQRSTEAADVFADLPFVLAAAALSRQGFQLSIENPLPVGGLMDGGRVVVAFFGGLRK